MIKNIEVIAMVYKSCAYTQLINDQLTLTRNNHGFGEVSLHTAIVANDPYPAVADLLAQMPQVENHRVATYNDPRPQDYYLNRVYRCWNKCVEQSCCEWVCLVNSDMCFEQDWLNTLIPLVDHDKIVCSRLVESGKLLSGAWAISQNFGRTPQQIHHQNWKLFAQSMKNQYAGRLGQGGLFMPCIFNRQQFLDAGGYPEGNIYSDGVGTQNGPVKQSGDAWFFDRYCKQYNATHLTVLDSLVYHIQEGEKDE